MAIKLSKRQMEELGLSTRTVEPNNTTKLPVENPNFDEDTISKKEKLASVKSNEANTVTEDQYDLSLSGLDDRLIYLENNLKRIAFSSNYYDLETQCRLSSSTENGLMSSGQYNKLSGIEDNANRYVHPNWALNSAPYREDGKFRHFVSEIDGIQRIAVTGQLSDLPGRQIATASKDGLFSKESYTKLYSIKSIAETAQFSDLLFGSNSEFKNSLNTTTFLANNTKHGFMSSADKRNIDSFFSLDKAGKHNVTHLTGAGFNHIPAGGSNGQHLTWNSNGEAKWENPVTYYTVDGSGLSITGDEYSKKISCWFGTEHTDVARGDHKHDERYFRMDATNCPGSGQFVISNGDKGVIVGLGEQPDVYIQNAKGGAAIQICDDQTLKFSAHGQSHTVFHTGNLGSASQSYWGLMSAEDKRKLDSIAWSANNYSHPATHDSSMITNFTWAALGHKPAYIDGTGATRTKIGGTYYTATVSGNTLVFS